MTDLEKALAWAEKQKDDTYGGACVQVLAKTVKRLEHELSDGNKKFARLYEAREHGLAPDVICCPVCAGHELIRLAQREDAPELFSLTCGECGSHATIQLFKEREGHE